MRLFLAWVTDIAVAFNPALHCDVAHDGFDLDLVEVEGEYASIKIVRTQTGWGFLSPSQPKCAIVSWSPTGLVADAVVLARGRVTEMPGNLFSFRQEILLTCAPKDIDDRVLTWAKARLRTEPEIDTVFSDWDEEAASSYLAGRSAVYHVDPVTHAISLVDDLEGDRIIDLRGLGYLEGTGPSDGPGTDGPLVKTVRGKLTVAWTQASSGTTNIANLIGDAGVIRTLDPDFAANIQGGLNFEDAEGWSLSPDGIKVSLSKIPTAPYDPGAVYEALNYPPGDGFGNVGEAEVTEHRMLASFMEHLVRIQRFDMQFSYSQDREETVFAALDLPILDTGIEQSADDVLEMSLADVLDDPVVPEYEIGTDYAKGEIVRYDGAYYRCVRAHKATDFYQVDKVRTRVTGTGGFAAVVYDATVGMWVEVPSPTGVVPTMASFIDSARGRRCVHHMMMRLRKEGRRRLRARRIRLRYPWADAVHVRRSDSVRIDVPWGDGMRDIVGKVLSITKAWPERKAPFVEIEIGVSFGNGGEHLASDAYGDDGYGEMGYSAASSTHADVEFDIDAPQVSRALDVHLPRTAAAVLQSRHGNGSDVQLAAAFALAAQGGDVRECSVVKPTWIAIRMRPVINTGTLRREIDVVGELAVGPSGVSLL